MTDFSKGDDAAGVAAKAEAEVQADAQAQADMPAEAKTDRQAPRRRKPNKAKQAAPTEPAMPLHFADCSPAWRAFYEHLAKEV